jgi:hypothetical protein
MQRLEEGWWRGASHFWKVASRAVRRLPDHTRDTLRTPAAVPGFYVRARRLAFTHPVRVSKNYLGIEVDHRRDHPIDFARNAGKASQGKGGSGMLYRGWSFIGLRRTKLGE